MTSRLASVVLLGVAAVCNAQAPTQDVHFAKELVFDEFFATRKGDARQYFLLGGGWLLTIQSGNPGRFISDWLEAHPAATATPVSRMFVTNTKSKVTSEMVYIWVDDGNQSLNVDLVRAGVFPAGVMYDMVDNQKGLEELLKDPRLAAAKAQIEKERAEAPQDRSERLMTDNAYLERINRVNAAEELARKEKVGIWSDAMKEEREADGLP
ncbi:MAG: hypothetical protein JSS29_05765 [Proteobacteria bacterium]|nr:hypothetical protein [Pseudomonadota bacterium]